MTVWVRAASAEDAAGIARVHVDAWRAAYEGLLPREILDPLSVPNRTEQWRRGLEPGGERTHTLVAIADERLVGFVTLKIPARDEEEGEEVGEIPALYVAPARWGDGLGSALMTAALGEMRAAGCRAAMLWMLGGNERAARFYERGGWRDDGGRRPSQYFPEVRELVEVRWRRDV